MTTDNWSQLQTALAAGPVCLVEVWRDEGSAPRAAGAWMAVHAGVVPGRLQGLIGSIGGGHLEYQAIAHALELLSGRGTEGVQRYALGPTLGQCCGGVVHLRFSRLALAELPQWQHLRPRLLPVAIFGAGHVGTALVRLLAALPCQTTWIDSRTQIWPPDVVASPQLQRMQCDPVQDAVADLPAHARVLIMTHSHVEDWELVAACLARQRSAGDLPWVGLIGSASKWASFRRRLRERGFSDAQLDAVHSPIGVPGLIGKEPEVIALSVAAQLMQLR